ncbi:hypothetical protein [Falsiroseomonas sp. HW251]|uniref:hypothetical protein n=1 Tax=Falsiroseomonas sp. HW251 TaxID=3390998 RepID=UPI003D31B3C9
MSVTDAATDAAELAARRASVSRQLDLVLDERGPVQLVRRLIADLDDISAELARALREPAESTPDGR